MSLTKKHFKALAELLGKAEAKNDTLAGFQESLIQYLKSENPRFSPDRFRAYIAKTIEEAKL